MLHNIVDGSGVSDEGGTHRAGILEIRLANTDFKLKQLITDIH